MNSAEGALIQSMHPRSVYTVEYDGQILTRSDSVIGRTGRQGLPMARCIGGTSSVTTLPAPITAPRPMVTPGNMVTPPQIHTSDSMVTGSAFIMPSLR